MHADKSTCMCINVFGQRPQLPSARRKHAVLLKGASEQVTGGAAPGGEQRTDAFRVSGAPTRGHSVPTAAQRRQTCSSLIQYGAITAATKRAKTHEDFIDKAPDKRPLSREQLWEQRQRSRWEEEES